MHDTFVVLAVQMNCTEALQKCENGNSQSWGVQVTDINIHNTKNTQGAQN